MQISSLVLCNVDEIEFYSVILQRTMFAYTSLMGVPNAFPFLFHVFGLRV